MERVKSAERLKRFMAIILAGTALSACSMHGAEAIENPMPKAAAQTPEQVLPPPPPKVGDKLRGDLTAAMLARGYTGEMEVAVRNHNTGEVIDWTNLPPDAATGKTYDTASTIKFSILLKRLLVNQAHGVTLGGSCPEYPQYPPSTPLTCGELEHAVPMIGQSSNYDASALWTELGGVPALQDFFDHDAKTQRTVADVSGQWGFTRTTGDDQLAILNLLSDPASPLTPESKQTVNILLDGVVPYQHWGASGQVPAGGPSAIPADVSVRLKNGWMPYSDERGGTWTINSIAHIEGEGADYDLAMCSDMNLSDSYGEDTLGAAAAVIWQDLYPTV